MEISGMSFTGGRYPLSAGPSTPNGALVTRGLMILVPGPAQARSRRHSGRFNARIRTRWAAAECRYSAAIMVAPAKLARRER